MNPTRREFVELSLLVLGAASVPACTQTAPADSPAPLAATGPIDAGPATAYTQDGIYGAFRSRGFFLVRRGAELIALSSICTHRRCTIDMQKDGTFQCPCHGARFDGTGHLAQGPAQRDLPRFKVSEDANGHVWVDTTQMV